MEQNLIEFIFDKRLKKLRTISDILKFLDINQFHEILNDDYFRDVALKSFRVFYELSIMWLQFELPGILVDEIIKNEKIKSKNIKESKLYAKIKSISTERIRKKIDETGIMKIAAEIYNIMDLINSVDRADEIFKLDERFFMIPPNEIINRLSVKIEEEKFLLNELLDVLKKKIDSKLLPGDNFEEIIEH